MPYNRSNKLPAMIVNFLKIYIGKHPWLFAAVAGLFALSALGGAYMVFNCQSSCQSSCARSKAAYVQPEAAEKSPCAGWKAKHDAAAKAHGESGVAEVE